MSLQINFNRPLELAVNNNGQILSVIAAWDSGVGPYNVVVRTDGENSIFLFDSEGKSLDPLVTLSLDSDIEWSVSSHLMPQITIETDESGTFVTQYKLADGTISINKIQIKGFAPNLSKRQLVTRGSLN